VRKTLDLTPNPGEMLKPVELIDLKRSGPLTLQDRRVFNILVQQAWGPKLGQPGVWFEIDTSALRSSTDRNTRLSETLERLMQTIVVVVDKTAQEELRTPLLSTNKLKTTANKGRLQYRFTEELAALLRDSTIFAKLDLAVMKSFSSKYAFALYEVISRRIRQQHKFLEELTIDGLRDLLGVEDGKLTDYKNLNNRAIEPALEEVNSLAPFTVTLAVKKNGKKVVGFVMGWSVKTEAGMKEAYAELQRSRVGRKARLAGTTEDIPDDATS
jgi:plasmid replication initiation protein